MRPITRRDTLRIGLGAGAVAILSRTAAHAQGAVKASFVLTNDIYEMSEKKGRGGMARLAAVVKAEREKNPNTIFVHAGDTLSPSLMSGFDQGAHMIEFLNAMKLDAFTPGNHEFDFGKDVFLKRVAEAKFPVHAANIRMADGSAVPGVQPSAIREVGGVRIGLIGSALETTAQLSSPGDLKFSPSIDSIRAEAKALREKGADFIVALTHTDRSTDLRLFDMRAVDLLLTGHDHDLRVNYDGKTAMAESGEDAEYVVVVEVAFDLKVDAAGKRALAWSPQFRIIDTATVTPDPEVLAIVKRYEAELSKELDVTVGSLDVELDSRNATVRGGEAAIGNFIADAMRDVTGADVAITNGGGIRANKQYAAGAKLSRRDILSELPFGNKTALTEITGAALKAALENGFSQIENRGGRFPQVSGLKIEVDSRQPVGKRVVSVLVNGAPLDEAKLYKVATNDFMLRGGDGYTALAGKVAATIDSGGSLMANDVMVYARKVGTVNARVEGRTVVR
ncbi:multifunctional 2',3'-cyclic-nucleotide 2'-phosphodiesterase/5'-nucleotidase/3'-nucleotidase [Alsobacter metallidurans]|uniref:Multifunctional 2',3'-cyclic-nucleotide 2'-phosphodiesterase/5'-nucleotidase/3'-nucleotidase n=1 Tax=Alsobacter metallidurans TaxID=340221 RepID=A0A917IBP6_9HYPH|nr:bifunctional UDP-sugar hydrolase/5'-nucleotidase [Alsobacter metallidurans]GGH30466.1 multifunctional 2',3'-cyclic-nucleotide 2'-phosphodiesterase/5'-nucleotidase/3'-nucleotidase [Alsobacter metallidurans]